MLTMRRTYSGKAEFRLVVQFAVASRQPYAVEERTISSRLGFPFAPRSDDRLQIGAPRFDFAEVCESHRADEFSIAFESRIPACGLIRSGMR